MTVFAWILFVYSALATLSTIFLWFADGKGLLPFLFYAAFVVYMIFYLFLTPFGAIVTWVYFIGVCIIDFIALIKRSVGGFIYFSLCALFFALVLFL